MVLCNGRLQLGVSSSLPAGLKVFPLAAAYLTYRDVIDAYLACLASYDQDPFVALNTALFDEGVFVYLEPHTQLEKPLILHHYHASGGPGMLVHPRILLVLGHHSSLQVVETFYTSSTLPLFVGRVAEVVVSDHARLHLYSLQHPDPSPSLQMHYTHVHQGSSSQLSHYAFTLAGSLVRNHVQVNLAGQGSRAALYGLYATRHNQYVEDSTVINHKSPYTTSTQLYKGTASGPSTAVFNGTIHVHSSAQKTQATQAHHAWVLTPQARVRARPQLSIHADDVQCSHGATISQPDEKQLFYLRTRGLSLQAARKMLLDAFLQQVTQKISMPFLQSYICKHLLLSS